DRGAGDHQLSASHRQHGGPYRGHRRAGDDHRRSLHPDARQDVDHRGGHGGLYRRRDPLQPLGHPVLDGERHHRHRRRGGRGPIVATAGPVTIIDEAYTLTPDRTLITEGDTVVFTAAAIHSNPSATLYWTVNGTIDTDDVVGGALSGSVTLSGGEGTISITLS